MGRQLAWYAEGRELWGLIGHGLWFDYVVPRSADMWSAGRQVVWKVDSWEQRFGMESHLPNDPDGSDPVGWPASSCVLARVEALNGHTAASWSFGCVEREVVRGILNQWRIAKHFYFCVGGWVPFLEAPRGRLVCVLVEPPLPAPYYCLPEARQIQFKFYI